MPSEQQRDPPGSLCAFLLAQVDNAPLVLFRILFGCLIAADCFGAIATGWVTEALVDPKLSFTFMGFEWLRALLGPGMYLYVAVMGLLGVTVMLGLWYRVSIATLTIMWTIAHLMQTSSYNNHYYLYALLLLLLCLSPAHQFASLDARRNPSIRRLTCPRWSLLAFPLQVSLVYVFAAIAKLDSDWLAGRPLATWLGSKTDYPLIGWFYEVPGLPRFLAWGGLAFDGLIVPLLLWKRTRIYAFIASIGFHLFNAVTFQVGTFPFVALCLSVFFFPGESVRRCFFRSKPVSQGPTLRPVSVRRRGQSVLALLSLFFVLQTFLPVRHWLYAGDVNWTEEGHRLAWRMMLRVKSGWVTFDVHDPTSGSQWEVLPQTFVERGILTQKQAIGLPVRPEHIWQFSQFLNDWYAERGFEGVEVYARTGVSLNGRGFRPMVDPTVDLAAVSWRYFSHNPWILPR